MPKKWKSNDDGFKWGVQEASTFEELKHRLFTTPVLSLPDFNEVFFIEAYASANVIGTEPLEELIAIHDWRLVLTSIQRRLWDPGIKSAFQDDTLRARKWYNEDEVVEQFIKHFQTFLGGNGEDPIIEDAENLFTIKLSENEASAMTRDVTDLEIKEAIFDIDNDKAPGPNGFTALFFKKSWDIVGKDACLAIKEFFKSKKLLYEVNATLVTLIPKTNQPKKVSDFRPIACCNVVYKCISKILTNGIKGGLEKLVNMNQSSFIPGRLIQDNLLITQELLKGYNRKPVLRDVQ
ncbi:RNA-directed DNA polymerase, eukaryota, reverse transcriptase zinc-binding domain protein [Tanacetum coccineum]